MNQTMPDMALNSALRSFGHWSLKGGGETMLNYGPTNWKKPDFQAAVDGVPWGAGASPADLALDHSSEDMASMGKNTAVILIGDGKYHDHLIEGSSDQGHLNAGEKNPINPNST
jgi:OOP family OmpA-OmpF porin